MLFLAGLVAFVLGSDDCPYYTTKIGLKCVHNECVIKDYRGVPSECGGLGYCSEKPVNSWGCVCMHNSVAAGRSCIPLACVEPGTDLECSGNGMCVREKCICSIRHSGTYCEKRIDEVCPDNMVAAEGYCVVEKCRSNDGLICGGHGYCYNDHRYFIPCFCDTDFDYTQSGCYPSSCLGVIDSTDELVVCNGHGECEFESDISRWACDCEKGYVSAGNTCAPSSCVSPDTGSVCGTHGYCTLSSETNTYTCRCLHGYTGAYCEVCAEDAVPIWSGLCLASVCASYDDDGNLLVCNNLGGCNEDPSLPAPKCTCSDEAFPKDGNCYPTYCKTGPREICSGHGTCNYNGCKCEEGYSGVFCEYEIITCPEDETFLDGSCYPSACVIDNTLCSYFGQCVKDEVTGTAHCVCGKNLLQASDGSCVPLACVFNGEVCPGMGPCQLVGQDEYECYCNYFTSTIVDGQCVPYKYLSKNIFGEYIICSGHGRYDLSSGACVCHALYSGPSCEFCAQDTVVINGECYPTSCVNIRHDGTAAVCGNYGQCMLLHETQDPASETYSCACQMYDHETNLCVSNVCMPFAGGPICSGHGYCDGGACVCDSGYLGIQCEY